MIRLKLLFTDTDSVCVQINIEDLYKDMKEFHHELDCSDYPPDHSIVQHCK